MSIFVAVQSDDFCLASEYHELRRNPACGAIVTFSGLVRELHDTVLHGMTLEHYPGMTEQALNRIATDALNHWQLAAVHIIHRVGRLKPNEQIVFVGVASAHRAAAFAACEFIMDYLKNRAPFWKKEHTATGDYWVEAKASDQQALARWE
ncbi:MAG: molybdopterin synthase catalytic subunit MoaE [Rheinheimera sp.]|uniref:molybdopterin synthase catalytic subunit MoaE n=1 Tax=Arsukibacterium sp. UBA3155 TaxID=1946058 RepID=UPI000C949982|nr:molybdopterin synthase catalytic subunit MoaE [Arsukibacterium sp. UBA3155]MAD74666.1 molybdopterin synthase catalytic subunit MoaE [Rheinheimera sp.]|tara:strand:+ start:99300 stop:99749 length:450 start_codon:yes stop_codon:yes gene_type:complete